MSDAMSRQVVESGSALSQQVRLEPLTPEHVEEFLAAVKRSRRLHGRWVAPPSSPADFKLYAEQRSGPAAYGYVVRAHGQLAGVINMSGVMRGLFQSAFLGYYAFAPHEHRGYMSEALSQVVKVAFQRHRLHRLEANIQPDNVPSIALIKSVGFKLEGYSPRYLKIAGRWRDHERWALTLEDWRRAKVRE